MQGLFTFFKWISNSRPKRINDELIRERSIEVSLYFNLKFVPQFDRLVLHN